MSISKPVLGIIPARGGSKGVPRKNVRLLLGRPLIAHTIEAALQSRTVSRVIVSTDDAEIAEVARKAGAEVPFIRPAEFAGDTASSLSVVRHALAWLAQHESYRPAAVAVLPPTSPLRSAAQVDGTIELLWSSGLDSALTIAPVHNHPYYIFSREQDGRMKELLGIPNKPLRRQELPDFYAHSQAVVVSRTAYLEGCAATAPIFNLASLAGFEIDRESAHDIDTPIDLALAEMYLRQQQLLTDQVA